MKRVIKETHEETVSSKLCSISKYYGVSIGGSCLNRCFIVFLNSSFIAISKTSLTGTYTFKPAEKTNCLDLFINELLETGAKVYEFDTFKELSDWLNT